jgi:hypothetical protein
VKSRRSLILAVVGLIVLIVLAVLLVVGGGDDDGGSASDDTSSLPDPVTVPPPVTGNVTPEAQELIDLLDQGNHGHYHATYAVEGADASQSGTTTIEVWRDGDKSRRDTRVETDAGTADTVGIVDGDTAVACSRTGDDDFTCEQADSPEAVDSDVIGSIRSQLTGAEVTPRDDTIDGRDVRCWSFPAEDGQADICLDDDGVVVKLGTDQNALQLTDLDDDVPGDVFTPPAEVTAPAEG